MVNNKPIAINHSSFTVPLLILVPDRSGVTATSSLFCCILLPIFSHEQCNTRKNFYVYNAINTYQQVCCFHVSVNIKQYNLIAYRANLTQCVCTRYSERWILSLFSFNMNSCLKFIYCPLQILWTFTLKNWMFEICISIYKYKKEMGSGCWLGFDTIVWQL